MKFWVRRTSNRGENKRAPVKGAKRERAVCTSYGTWKTLDAARKDKGKDWFFSDGTFNHRKVRGGVAHDYHQDLWAIEIDTLEALMKLVEREGDVIISVGEDMYGNGPQIEIYDGYRE
jgi:hypothetical protein